HNRTFDIRCETFEEESSMMSRNMRWAAVVAGAALAVGGLAGCSGGASEGAGEDGDVTITWWHNATGEPLSGFWEDVAAEFEEDHPGVTVEVTGYQNEELQRTLIPNQLRTGSGLDLYQQWGAGELAAQVQAGHVMNLTDQLAEEVEELGGVVAPW